MDLNCKYSEEGYECNPEIFYWAEVTKAEITVEGSVVKSIKGTHIEGKSDEDVQALEFDGASVKFVPKGLSKIFPNLVVLRIINCNLEMITAEDLVGLENLKVLEISLNQLTSLPSNLLQNMKQLKWFCCSNNPLQHLSEKLLTYQNAKSLEEVTFLENECINRAFPSNCSTLDELKDAIASTCNPPKMEVEKFNKNLKVVGKFWHLWTTGNFSDFTIESVDKEFQVHKSVLVIQSSVFAKAVQIDMEESKSNRMRIDDFSSDAVEEFLKFFYSGEISEVNAMEVFALAAKYNFPELKYITEIIVADNVDKQNALEVLNLGNLHESEIIMTASFEMIKTILTDFELVDEMMKKPEDLLELLEAKKIHDAEMEASNEKYKKVVALKNCK